MPEEKQPKDFKIREDSISAIEDFLYLEFKDELRNEGGDVFVDASALGIRDLPVIMQDDSYQLFRELYFNIPKYIEKKQFRENCEKIVELNSRINRKFLYFIRKMPVLATSDVISELGEYWSSLRAESLAVLSAELRERIFEPDRMLWNAAKQFNSLKRVKEEYEDDPLAGRIKGVLEKSGKNYKGTGVISTALALGAINHKRKRILTVRSDTGEMAEYIHETLAIDSNALNVEDLSLTGDLRGFNRADLQVKTIVLQKVTAGKEKVIRYAFEEQRYKDVLCSGK